MQRLRLRLTWLLCNAYAFAFCCSKVKIVSFAFSFCYSRVEIASFLLLHIDYSYIGACDQRGQQQASGNTCIYLFLFIFPYPFSPTGNTCIRT